jgi:hypothetical protein
MLEIMPRQTINMVCRPLAEAGTITRIRKDCDRCQKTKLTNTYGGLADRKSIIESQSKMPTPSRTSLPRVEDVFDIEKARTEIVRICRALWEESIDAERPRGHAAIIVELRNQEIIPAHIANMMLTVSGIRNSHVYELLELRERELVIATNAQAIIRDWCLESLK